MNPAQLLSHFHRISDALDAIPRLRRFILDLAVRGKLVEQDLRDEPASELLKEIEAEKVGLVKAGKIRKQEPAPQVAIEDQPFELPSNWQWVRFGSIAEFSAGRTPSRHDFSFWDTGDYPWVSIADMRDGGVVAATKETISAKAKNQVFRSEPAPVGTVIMSFKLTIGKISRLGIPAFHNEAIISIHPYFQAMDDYLFKVLPQFSLQGNTKDAIKGATLNRDSITNIFLPLPPLAEQHRIVAKVDELMALCDRLEAAQAERESRRDRLVVSSLNRLNNGADPDAFHDHARFYFNHLPRLTAKPEHIQQLRQAILNLAVRGRLVPQDPNDEPASQLLRNIDDVKRQLVKGKKGKTPTASCSVDHRARPYELPATWEWVRLGELCQFENGDRSHNYPSGSDIKNDGVPFINTKNIFQHKVRLENLDFITEEKFKSLRSGKLMDRDILIVLRGSVGKLGLFEASDRYKTGFINAQLLILRNYHPKVVDYCLTYLMSQLFQDLAFEQSSGSAQPQLSAGNLSSVLVPLPPLVEQQHIVAKVNELMALCDKLEAQLTTTQTESRRLLEAVLHRTLPNGQNLRSGI